MTLVSLGDVAIRFSGESLLERVGFTPAEVALLTRGAGGTFFRGR